jgi:hypothetical protein
MKVLSRAHPPEDKDFDHVCHTLEDPAEVVQRFGKLSARRSITIGNVGVACSVKGFLIDFKKKGNAMANDQRELIRTMHSL